MDRIVDELSGFIKGRYVFPIRLGDRGPNVCVLDPFDVLDGSIGGIASDLPGTHPPAKIHTAISYRNTTPPIRLKSTDIERTIHI